MTELFKPHGDPRPQAAQRRLFDIRQVPREAPEMTPEQRYPRGYTPGRMAEVRSATDPILSVPSYGEAVPPRKEPCPTCGGLGHSPQWTPSPEILNSPGQRERWKEMGAVVKGGVVHSPGKTCYACGGKGKVTAYSAMQTGREMGQSVDHPFYAPHGVRMMQEALARSTIPMEHLQGLREVGVEPVRKVGHQSAAGVYGQYTPSSKRIRLFPVPAKTPRKGPMKGQRLIEPIGEKLSLMEAAGMAKPAKVTAEGMVPVRSPSQVQQSEGTLIHEIGHHVSQGPAGPAEEAAADRYMVEHWRTDPRNARNQRAADMRRMTYLARGTHKYTPEMLEQTAVPTPKGRKK